MTHSCELFTPSDYPGPLLKQTSAASTRQGSGVLLILSDTSLN